MFSQRKQIRILGIGNRLVGSGCTLRIVCGLFRGTFHGGGLLIRPLLNTPKADILEFCEQNSLAYVTDATNADDSYSRNHIRHNIIPPLKHLNGGVLKNTARLSESARIDADFIDGHVNSYLARPDASSLAALRELHPAILRRALARLYTEASGGLAPEQTHIFAMETLIERGIGGSSVSLPGLVRAQIVKKHLVFVPDPRKSFRHL